MNRRTIEILVTLCLLLSVSRSAHADAGDQKSVLIVVEGSSSLKNYAIGDGRQLATLLGHFNTRCTIKGVNDYIPGEMRGYDITFYVGFHAQNIVPSGFLNDVLSLDKKTVWLNTGFAEFSSTHPVTKRFGFSVSQVDSQTVFDIVRFGNRTFTKGEPNINVINIVNRKQVTVIATAQSTRKRKEVPYIVASGTLTYVADSPFASATETDRYLLFADLLHDILGEQHEESHSAILRIEDVGPLDDPDRLRDIADILSSRGVPFLVSVIPFYVDPGQGLRISLSDKPDLVDALKYMVRNGATITMHGVTHQYKGITAADFEFWDESTNKPIKGETPDDIERKLDLGIQEFMKNGLFPLAWETPHYTGSFLLYQTVAQFFSTAVEQRLSIEDVDYSQFFPYVIQKDLFGQRIYPENLGYIPLDPDKRTSEGYVQSILKGARANLSVRDGFASCFFHSFLDLDLLKQLVDGVQSLGYTYIDLTEHANWVQTGDRVILTGSHSFTVALQDQFLSESYFDNKGELLKRTISEQRIRGSVSRNVDLPPGQIYKAEPTEFREREISFVDNMLTKANTLLQRMVSSEADWQEARIVILWNHYAKGAAYNDQASLAAVFGTVNLPVDTIFLGQELRFQGYNLLIVPYASVDSLKPPDYDAIMKYVSDGGCVITDRKNDLAEELGVRFSPAQLRIRAIRDRYFPEESITWRYYELMNKLDVENAHEVFCQDASTDAPVVIGKQVGKGKLLFFGTRFDPYSQHGYSHYPYLLEYVRRYFRLGPIVRRENLEAYFDPGFRSTYSIEDLVKQWVRVGIRRIHVAGWHEYPKYAYDYARLIRLAHANGILVYAWLEPPQVSQKFWLEHPEWREKNFRGADARPSWRYPVALTDSACLRQMAANYRKILESVDWDGVNLAELYFETDKGFETPPQFTPMHPSAVREVRRKFGFELSSIFDPNSPAYWKTNPVAKSEVIEYRIAKLTEVYERLLTEFTQIAKAKEGFQIIVTAMDSYGSPELREQIGVDMRQILALRKRFDFLLQVEDPEHLWSTDPLRYVQIGERYEQLIGHRTKLLLDLNILSFRRKSEITPFPTLIQTGTESFLLINAASIGAPRLTFYAESSVNPQDLPYFANAAATGVVYRRTPDGYEVDAERSFVLKLPKETRQILIDGMVVTPVRDGLYVLPAGKHLVSMDAGTAGAFSTSQLQPRLISSTGTILALSYGMRDVRFSYEADERMLVSFSNEPTQITLDGQPHSVTALKGNDCFTITLPAGTHKVQVVTGDTFSYGINVTSLWSTTAIAIFGLVAVLLLVGMYVGLKLIRRRFVSPQRLG
jgi:uncharacterized protein YdaL